MSLNKRARTLFEHMLQDQAKLRLRIHFTSAKATIVDCGLETQGGLEAGRRLAEICLAGLGEVRLTPGRDELWQGPSVAVATDHPLAACMASQYAGWQISMGKYFAMGSGPMRAAAGQEDLFDDIGLRETADFVVGVLESGALPGEEVCQSIADSCGVSPAQVALLVAPTASQAGSVQVAARSVETALHKMHALKFDLARVESGYGTTPLAPVAANDLAAIGRTNDAVLYGGQTTLWVRGDDESLERIGPQIPSFASPDFGEPFSEIFNRYERDFYKIDPHLFSPAAVTLINCDTGRVHRHGEIRPDILQRSFLS